jgi:hypothetical protein
MKLTQYKLDWSFCYGVNKCVEETKDTLRHGESVLFLNKKRDRIRLLTLDSNGLAISIVQSLPKGHQVDPRALRFLPTAFAGKRLDINAATNKFLTEFLKGE